MASRQAAQAGARILNFILSLPEFHESGTVMTCLSFSGEVDTFGLANAVLKQGKKLVVPKVNKSSKSLVACEITNLENLLPNQYGIMEPDESHAHPFSPGDIDFHAVPGLAFCRSGFRLGRGGGYYDRFLETVSPRAFLAGVCYDFQIVDDLPIDPWDKPVHAVISEKGILRIG
jgi:5-formyltetrahydrofolate cyclo-ligase